MSLLIGILDNDGNTDVIIFIDHEKRIIHWIPRDFYSVRIMNRINFAYRSGGLALFKKCVEDFGFHSISNTVCIPIQSCRKVLNRLKIYVDISNESEYFYPSALGQPLESGKKIINFNPPGEMLQGERIHQYIGARYRTKTDQYVDLPDFERIGRQQIFVQALIRDRFKFSTFLRHPIDIEENDLQDLRKLLKLVKYDYTCQLFKPTFTIKKIRRQLVLFIEPQQDKTLFLIRFWKKNTFIIIKEFINSCLGIFCKDKNFFRL